MTPSLADVCTVACAELFRGDGEILASPIGVVPTLGVKLARATFAPDLLVTDGIASLVNAQGEVEGWLPYRRIFEQLWWGRRHVVMGASQLDRHGNQNLSCVGAWERPSSMLIGARGAPGNTVCHPVSYWIPRHSRRVFVDHVDFVGGVGTLRARGMPFHALRGVVTNLGVFNFGGIDGTMRPVSLHPGVTPEEVLDNTGFPMEIPPNLPVSRGPSPVESQLLSALDPEGRREAEWA